MPACNGSRPPSPTILEIVTPGSSFKVSTTSSPGKSTANPRISNPQQTLATVAGAKALTDFKLVVHKVRDFPPTAEVFPADRADLRRLIPRRPAQFLEKQHCLLSH